MLFPTRSNLALRLAHHRAFPRLLALVAALLATLFLSACQPAPSTPPPITAPASSPTPPATLPVVGSLTLAPAPSPTPEIAALAPPTATPQPSPTPLTCWSELAQVETGALETELLRQPLDYRVALPPCYDELSEQRYPVLYLIHGQSYTDDQWVRLGAPQVAAELVASGELPPFIIVMPRDRLWLEPRQDPFGQALVEVLIPHIDSTYRTLPERASRAVGGLSRGGAWALHLGLSYWETFGAIGLHSGFAFQSDITYVKRWLDAIPFENMPRIYMDVSDNDRPEIAQSAAWFERLLTGRGIAHEWHLFPGYHEEAYWSAHVEQYLRWYAAAWK